MNMLDNINIIIDMLFLLFNVNTIESTININAIIDEIYINVKFFIRNANDIPAAKNIVI